MRLEWICVEQLARGEEVGWKVRSGFSVICRRLRVGMCPQLLHFMQVIITLQIHYSLKIAFLNASRTTFL